MPVAAQTADSVAVAVVRALGIGRRVRLDVSRLGRVEGRLLRVGDTTLTVVRDDGPSRIRLPDIERLWARGRATGTGALVGAGVGAVVGAAFGLLLGSVACEPVDGGDCTTAEVATITGLLGGAGGALAGAGVGFVIHTWKLRYP